MSTTTIASITVFDSWPCPSIFIKAKSVLEKNLFLRREKRARNVVFVCKLVQMAKVSGEVKILWASCQCATTAQFCIYRLTQYIKPILGLGIPSIESNWLHWTP